MAYETRFDGKADNYSAARPSYSEELIDLLYREMGGRTDLCIGDIGSGTGKLSAQLLKRGSTVYGVEPNSEMRTRAEEALKGYERFRSVEGCDIRTGLEDRSVDHITAGQAFHWFDPAGFRTECSRILRPGGKIFLIWNTRDLNCEVNRRWRDLFCDFAPDFTGFNNGLSRDDSRIRMFFPEGYSRAVFPNPLWFSQDLFRKRILSSSYAPKAGDMRYEAFLRRGEEIFAEFQENGRICVPHESVVYWGE